MKAIAVSDEVRVKQRTVQNGASSMSGFRLWKTQVTAMRRRTLLAVLGVIRQAVGGFYPIPGRFLIKKELLRLFLRKRISNALNANFFDAPKQCLLQIIRVLGESS